MDQDGHAVPPRGDKQEVCQAEPYFSGRAFPLDFRLLNIWSRRKRYNGFAG